MESSEGVATPFWRRAEAARLERGWSVVQLAERAGIDRGTYIRLKTGRRTPLPDSVRRIASALGIPPTEAFRLAGLIDELDVELVPVEGEYVTIDVPAGLSPAERQLVIDTARDLARRLKESDKGG